MCNCAYAYEGHAWGWAKWAMHGRAWGHADIHASPSRFLKIMP